MSVITNTIKRLARGLLGPSWFQAFLTGSRVYGAPKVHDATKCEWCQNGEPACRFKGSDVDLVVFMHPLTIQALVEHGAKTDAPFDAYAKEQGKSLRFGNLNLICISSDKVFLAWQQGTSDLRVRAKQRGKPFSRKTAVNYIEKLRERAQGVTGE